MPMQMKNFMQRLDGSHGTTSDVYGILWYYHLHIYTVCLPLSWIDPLKQLNQQTHNIIYFSSIKICCVRDKNFFNPIHAGGGGRIPPRSYNFYCQFFKNGHVMLIFRHF